MRTFVSLPKLIALCFVMAACTSYESARNAHQAREYLTEDIEEMIVFNLIRAANGLPFAHYDVSTVQSLVSMKATGKATGTRAGANNGFRPSTVVTSAVRTITRTFNGEVGGERNNSVTVNIAPVFDDPKIYASYVTFLNLKQKGHNEADRIPSVAPERRKEKAIKESASADSATDDEEDPKLDLISKTTTETTINDKEGNEIGSATEVERAREPAKPPQVREGIKFEKIYSLRRSPGKPEPGKFLPHTVRKWDDDMWYYVPIEYQPEFSDLCLSLVARSGASAASGGGSRKKDTKALEQLNNELIRQNTLLNQKSD